MSADCLAAAASACGRTRALMIRSRGRRRATSCTQAGSARGLCVGIGSHSCLIIAAPAPWQPRPYLHPAPVEAGCGTRHGHPMAF